MSLVHLSSFLLLFCTYYAKVIADSDSWVNPDYNQEWFSNSRRLENNEIKKVKLQVYYETLNRGSIYFNSQMLAPVIKMLDKNLDLYINPYGKTKTIIQNETIEFECQYGEKECYGNKLHACALDIINNNTKAVLFNACMMDTRQSNGNSDDEAADNCANSMKEDSKPITTCAKGKKGTQILKQCGDETQKVHLPYLPYILINGKELDRDVNFFYQVCRELNFTPLICPVE